MNLREYIKTPQDRKIIYQDKDVKLEAIFEKQCPLNHIDGFYNMELYNNFSVGDNTNQEIFFVANGHGEIILKKERKKIEKDYAFILRPEMHCIVKNTSKQQPLEMLVIVEELPKNSNKEIIIKNADDIPLNNFAPPVHWCLKSKTIFSYEKDSLSKVHYISLVYIDRNKLPEPHAHFPGHDEIWHALEGKTIMAFKDNLMEQNPGTSILIPDNGKIPHTTITTKEQAKFLFVMHNMALDNRILVTGSRGTIGRIITPYLKNNGYQFITEIDRDNPENPIDILNDNIAKYFEEVDIIIHLAANSNPFIEKDEADKNIGMTKRIIEACRDSNKIKRIINTSSINVYPYRTIETITAETSLSSNLEFNKKGYYGKAKIESERLLERYCKDNNISLLNLRLGWVTKNDKHPPYREDKPHPRDLEIALKHEDLKKIILKAINCEGIENYVCISNRRGFINEGILSPL